MFNNSNKWQLAGYVVFFLCWLPPFAALFIFSKLKREDLLAEHPNLLIGSMLCVMALGAILIVIGSAVKRYPVEAARGIIHCLKAWHYCLFGLIAAVTVDCIAMICQKEMLSSTAFLIATILFYVALIAWAIRREKDKKNPPAAFIQPDTRKACCACCKKRFKKAAMHTHGNRLYCPSCFETAIQQEESLKRAKKEEMLKKEAEEIAARNQTRCSGCGRTFPQSALSVVDDVCLCEECFDKAYKVNLS